MSTDPAPAVDALVDDDDPVVRFGLTTRDTARRRLTLLADLDAPQ